MSNKLQVTKIKDSTISQVDFSNIPFGKVFSDHMYVADYYNGKWQDFRIVPLEKMSIHPGNLAWHYGQAIFEGMKATVTNKGEPVLFRVDKHIERLNYSAQRMCMPTFPENEFFEAIRTLVSLEKDWIPKEKGSAMYLRPVMFAMDESLGVRASDTYRFIIFTLPVGPYYPKPVSLFAQDKYVRAVKGGVGFAKTAGNYAASLYPAKLAKEKGYDQVMWLDAFEFKYIQEVGTMNIFFVIDGKVITPDTGDTVLRGITRMSVIEILKTKNIPVEERLISIDEVLEADKNGTLQEVFGTGTAAVIAMVNKINIHGEIIDLDPGQYEIAPMLKSYIEDLKAGEITDEFGWTEVLKTDAQPV